MNGWINMKSSELPQQVESGDLSSWWPRCSDPVSGSSEISPRSLRVCFIFIVDPVLPVSELLSPEISCHLFSVNVKVQLVAPFWKFMKGRTVTIFSVVPSFSISRTQTF